MKTKWSFPPDPRMVTIVGVAPFEETDDGRMFAAAEADNDQKALVLFFEENPDGDWIEAGWERRTEYRRRVYR